MKMESIEEQRQKIHFDQISKLYQAHYDDPCSRRYRKRYLYDPVFDSIDLSGKKVLEAMCGSGQITEYLVEKGAQVTGLDISEEMINQFRVKYNSNEAICASILNSDIETSSYDAVVVVGGLHHIHPNVNQAVKEIYRILKPGGDFVFVEPHQGSFFDAIRKFWYKRDRFFEKNEAAIDVEGMREFVDDGFHVVKERYVGNFAYLLVLNSMIFRIPVWFKPYYSRVLEIIESALGFMRFKAVTCICVGHWRKKR